MTDEERAQMIANRPCNGQGVGREARLPAPSSFAPIGYVSHHHVLECVAKHLLTELTEDGTDISDADTVTAIRECLNHLRRLLFARKLDAFYPSVVFDPPLQAIEHAFWGRDIADRVLLSGRYETGFEGEAEIFFKEGAIEAALAGDQAGQVASSGGRPSIQPAVRAAYWEIYPQGHGLEGDGWKAVAAKIGKHIGQTVSEDTVQRAVRGG